MKLIYTQDLYRALKEAIIKVENDNSLWNESWLVWKADAQDALKENTLQMLERRYQYQLMDVRAEMLQEVKDFVNGKIRKPERMIGIDFGYEIHCTAPGQKIVPVTPTTEMIAACGDLPSSMQEMWARALTAVDIAVSPDRIPKRPDDSD